jgi:hypothetical protein
MATLIIVFALIGATVGYRFQVVVLVPMILAAIVIGAVIAVAQGHHVWTTISIAALSAAGLQVGYLGGSFVRFLQIGVRADRHTLSPSATTPTSA